MKDEKTIVRKLRADARQLLINKAMQGSYASLFVKEHSSKELLSRGFDDDDLSQGIELATEFESLIRSGKSLAESLDHLCKTHWVTTLLNGVEK